MVIAFCGKMGSGKSTAIEVLKTSPLAPVGLVKFANKLYEIHDFIYRAIAPAYTPPEDFIKDRKLLQWVGTEFGRSLDEALWVKLWKKRVEHLTSRDSQVTIVCDDCRFDNEAKAVRSLGGVVIKLIRPDSEAHADGGVGIKGHASEGGIHSDLVDYTIENIGSLEDFKNSLKILFEQIKAGKAA